MRATRAAAIAIAVGASTFVGVARAEPTVPVFVSVPGSVTLRGTGALTDVSASCTSPCTLHLVPGEYKYSGGAFKNEPVAFTTASRLDLVPPTQPLHTASFVAIGVGIFATAIPIIAVFGTCSGSTDALGRQTESRCLDFGKGADLGLTILAGAGLALVALGGVFYFLSAGGLTVTDADTEEAARRRRARAVAGYPSTKPTFELDLARGLLRF